MNFIKYIFGSILITFLLFLILPNPNFSQTPNTNNNRLLITPESTVKMLFVGDIMLGRYLETLINKNGDQYPFEFWPEIKTKNYDFVIGNLEGPITQNHLQTPDFTTSFSFKPSTAKLLASQGFTHLSLANNHTFDKGEPNYLNTQKTITEAGLKWFGHPRILAEPYIVTEELKDIKTIFIGINEAVSKYFDFEQTLSFIAQTKLQNPDAHLIVYIHWGTEYQRKSNQMQQNWAQQAIDLGAEIVIGHHPHVTQEVEIYNNKYIFYSLGNFIFDQYFSQDTQEGLALEIELDKAGLKNLLLIPITSSKSQPQLMTEPRKTEFLKEINYPPYEQ